MKTQSKVSLYIILGGIIFNVLIQIIYDVEFRSKQLSIFLSVESATTVFFITAVNMIFILLILYIARIIRKRSTTFIVPSFIITILTFLVILLAAIDQYRGNEGHYGGNNKILYSIRTAEAHEKMVSSDITYQLPYVSKKKIKSGKIIEEKIEAQKLFGEPYVYKIMRLNTRKPILRKYIGTRLVEEKKLAVLNRTSQGNIYLADVSQAGNVFLISVFPKQQTVAISMQYWRSYEDVVILWQGFGLYK